MKFLFFLRFKNYNSYLCRVKIIGFIEGGRIDNTLIPKEISPGSNEEL